jgi:hypothetical protein
MRSRSTAGFNHHHRRRDDSERDRPVLHGNVHVIVQTDLDLHAALPRVTSCHRAPSYFVMCSDALPKHCISTLGKAPAWLGRGCAELPRWVMSARRIG